jgi:hypothetical protein
MKNNLYVKEGAYKDVLLIFFLQRRIYWLYEVTSALLIMFATIYLYLEYVMLNKGRKLVKNPFGRPLN